MKFDTLILDETLLKNLHSLGYENLSPIQEKTLVHTLKSKDIIARAKTGSGKTLAFCLPIVEALDKKKFRVQALILSPTRELATQISIELKKLFRHIPNIKVLSLCGGLPFKPQALSLKHQAHIVVGTVGRVLKHLEEKNLNLDEIKTFVLDEADKMLDMGFIEDLYKIEEYLPKQRQTMLFSATYSKNIEELSFQITKEPIFIELENEEENQIEQIFYEVEKKDEKTILALIKNFKAQSTIIFCNQKLSCENLANKFLKNGIKVLTLHSDLEQKLRDETLTLFSNKSYPILIASDLASRGLHINEVDLVINYDLALNEKIHTHRIGRTARAGKEGRAVSLYKNSELDRVLEIKNSFEDIKFEDLSKLNFDENFQISSAYKTIFINAGKKNKIRKGDILGAFIALGFKSIQISKIDLYDFCSYIAINKDSEYLLNDKANKLKIKGKFYNFFQK